MKEKIAFITCVNDEKEYLRSIKYIEELNIPENIELEFIPIRGAKSMTSGYNLAMYSTNAKYKVYLHQDTFIINKDFIKDIIEVFQNEEIGLIGVIGAKYLPHNGIWWEAPEKYGAVYENRIGTINLLSFSAVKEPYECVSSIDGLIMITQQDIKWREDIFDGWHFYDISQCMEFMRKKLKVVIPKQTQPWCLHDCGTNFNPVEYDFFRQRFITEYTV